MLKKASQYLVISIKSLTCPPECVFDVRKIDMSNNTLYGMYLINYDLAHEYKIDGIQVAGLCECTKISKIFQI